MKYTFQGRAVRTFRRMLRIRNVVLQGRPVAVVIMTDTGSINLVSVLPGGLYQT